MVFEEFLGKRKKASLDMADEEDVQAFVDSVKGRRADLNNCLRAVSLYYAFRSNPKLRALTSGLREQRLSSARKPCALRDFRGVDPDHVARLASAGIRNAEQMLANGKTQADRKKLSDKTGVPSEAILELVKLSDLSRIEGVKGIRARLYYDAGIDTVEKMAKWDPEELRAYMVEFIEKTKFEGIAPLPKEVKYTIETARKLPRIMQL